MNDPFGCVDFLVSKIYALFFRASLASGPNYRTLSHSVGFTGMIRVGIVSNSLSINHIGRAPSYILNLAYIPVLINNFSPKVR